MSDKNTEPQFDAIISVHDSSFISGVVYDHKALVMDVQMARDGEPGPIYRYENVTPLEFAMLITSKSTGRTYNAVIKGQKTCTRLDRKEL